MPRRERIQIAGFTADGWVRRVKEGVEVEIGPIGPGKLRCRAVISSETAAWFAAELARAAHRPPPGRRPHRVMAGKPRRKA